jgi:hypothetical protein
MNKEEFRCFLALLMCSDPWPVTNDPSNQVFLEGFADRQAREFGFKDWIDAYHKL